MQSRLRFSVAVILGAALWQSPTLAAAIPRAFSTSGDAAAVRRMPSGSAPRLFSIAQTGSRQSSSARSSDGVWEALDERSMVGRGQRLIVPRAYRTVRLNRGALEQILARTPLELTEAARTLEVVLTLPMPDGRFSRFRIESSPIMEPGLASKFPEIRTYRAQGLDDPTATARLDVTPQGFHGFILAAGQTVYVDPYAAGDLDNYITYDKRDFMGRAAPWVCLVGAGPQPRGRVPDSPAVLPLGHGTELRTYRLALAATSPYTAAAGGTKLAAMARMTTSMNRVNGIYERDLTIRMTFVANNDLIIYTDAAADPYTNSSGGTMLGENQTNLDAVIGNANYDIGHVFSTGGGGVAGLGVPCRSGLKARGVTGSSNPTGDPFDVDFVAHEIGHQWGGRHTFDGTIGSCAGNRSDATAYEPASGTTIQAYAGICGSQNLQSNSNDHFHIESLNEMSGYIAAAGGGASCGTPTATGNSVPTANAGPDHTIPMGTPFTMTATATDADADALTYNWEQHDLDVGFGSNTPSTIDNGSRPIFRSYPSTTSPSRTFPNPTFVRNNANVPPATYTGAHPVAGAGNCNAGNCITGEILPSTDRTMVFQLTVRDNRGGGGGVSSDAATVTVTTAAGPFVVTSPNRQGSRAGLGPVQTVTWNVAGTSAPPINVANVKISLSVDGGATFPIVLAANTPNDGSEDVRLTVGAAAARIKVEAIGNVFFDISDANFAIPDSDGDTLTDAFETQFGLDPSSGAGDNGPGGDPDGDSLTNAQEQAMGTHPRGFFTRFFAEGATAGSLTFDTQIATANPGATAAKVLYRFLKTDGTTVSEQIDLGAMTRHTLDVKSISGLADAEFSTVCESDVGVVSDRTMTWDGAFYGSHAETSIAAAALTWHLAEGSTSGFNLFYLVQNPNATASSITVTFLRPGGLTPIGKSYTVPANSRFNIWVNQQDAALTSTDVSGVVTVTNGVTVIVERAMYLDLPGQTFGAGHESAGVTTPSLNWFFAEGATGSFFDLFILLSNTSGTAAAVRADYLLPSGTVITKNYTVLGNSRFNIWVDLEDPQLVDTALSTTITVTNGVAIVAERSMWWVATSTPGSWFEAHNSPGSTGTGTQWGLAEGEVGGARDLETFILIANTSSFTASTQVKLMFEDGTSLTKTFTPNANSRFNVAVTAEFPGAAGRRFGTVVTSQPTANGTAQIVVERAMYSDAGGVNWAAGTNALATRLQP